MDLFRRRVLRLPIKEGEMGRIFIALTVYHSIARSFKAKRISALANEAVSTELKNQNHNTQN